MPGRVLIMGAAGRDFHNFNVAYRDDHASRWSRSPRRRSPSSTTGCTRRRSRASGTRTGSRCVTYINKPAGDINDSTAKIFPFKLHIAKQPYEVVNNYLLQPVTSGKDGFWTTFDWNSAFELAQDKTGLDYSGEYAFTTTYMYWPTTHMVQPADQALQCNSCHGENGRLDWEALGYPGDPVEWGGRDK